MISEPKLLLAPLQGFTDSYFRSAFHKNFGTVDQYYSPWIRSDNKGVIKKAQIRDVNPENNFGIPLIPQIMCNQIDDFLMLSDYLYNLGYQEINWNLGCPHPMVTNRGLGAALLKSPDKVISLLDAVLPKMRNKLSIKMRLGFEEETEILQLLPKLNDFPLTEIIIHARTAKQMYKGNVNPDAFKNCMNLTKHSLVFNGDITTYKSFKELRNRLPEIKKWMIGRGLIANPFLAGMIKNDTEQLPESYKEIMLKFHDQLLERYAAHLSGEKHLLLKMLSFWHYFSSSFKDPQKAFKRIKKAKTLTAYREAVEINMLNGFEANF